MATATVSAEREITAPPERVSQCIADYRRHHAHILPPALSDLCVEQAGYGAGTVICFKLKAFGRTQTARARVDKPQPERVLRESLIGREMLTTFTVTPIDEGCRARIQTRWRPAGVSGLLERIVLPRFLGRLYAEELAQLDRDARDQASTWTDAPARGLQLDNPRERHLLCVL